MVERFGALAARVRGVDRALVWTLVAHAVVAMAYFVVLFAPPVLPLMDLGSHVELGVALRHLGDGTRIGEAFEFGIFPAPNTLFYVLYACTSYVLPPLAATKFVVGIYIAGVPLGVLYVLRGANKNVAWSLGAYPMLLSWPFQSGFIDYCLSFVPLFFGLGLLDRTLTRGVSRTRVTALIFVSALTFLGHFQGGLFYALGASCLLLARLPLRTPEKWASWFGLACSSVLVVFALFVLWYVQAKVVIAGGHAAPPAWQDLDEKLRVAFLNTYFVLSNEYDGLVFYAVTLSILVACAIGVRGSSRRADGFVYFVVATAFAHALGPVTASHYVHFDNRIPALFSFLLLLALAPGAVPTHRVRNAAVLGTFTLAALASIAAWVPTMRQFEEWNEGFVETLSAAPDQTKLAYFGEDQSGSGFTQSPSLHFPGYHAALNLGVGSHSFANHPGRVVVQKRLGFDFEALGYADVMSAHRLDGYEVLLQRGSRRLESNPRFRLIARHAKWSVYAIVAAAP